MGVEAKGLAFLVRFTLSFAVPDLIRDPAGLPMLQRSGQAHGPRLSPGQRGVGEWQREPRTRERQAPGGIGVVQAQGGGDVF